MSEDERSSTSSLSTSENSEPPQQKSKKQSKKESKSEKPAKKRKIEESESLSSSSSVIDSNLPKDDDGHPYCDLGQKRRITINKWKNRLQIDIREYYEDSKSGEMKPGKKGIALSKEQWEEIKKNISKIDQAIEQLQN